MKAMVLIARITPGKHALLVAWPLEGSDFMALCFSSHAERHIASVSVLLVK